MSAGAGTATLGTAIAEATRRLADAGIEAPRREARLLAAAALGCDPARTMATPETPLDPASETRLRGFLARRLAGEPMSRIRGEREFWSLRFELSPATLDPRPDSETLIEAALAELPDRSLPYRVLDLGTGTGCLLLALLSELPGATGLGIDRAEDAVTTARRNAAALGLASRARFIAGDWSAGIAGEWDVILANPPYIPSAEIAGLAPGVVGYDPRLALDGGPDGLAAYRALAPAIARVVAPAGVALLEVGAGQAQAVAAIVMGEGLALRAIRPDLRGIERCLVMGPPSGPSDVPQKVVGMLTSSD